MMMGTSVFPSCTLTCASVEGGGADSGLPNGTSDSAGAGDAVARGGKGGAGDDPGLGVPWGTIISGKWYICHQLMLLPGLHSEPTMVCHVGVCGLEGGWDVRC